MKYTNNTNARGHLINSGGVRKWTQYEPQYKHVDISKPDITFVVFCVFCVSVLGGLFALVINFL